MGRKKKVPDNDRRAAYLAGIISVSDMDDEELARGKFRDKGGMFRGVTPSMPARFAQELARETMLRFNEKFRGALLSITNEQVRLALDAEKEEVRMKAGQYAIDRMMGKTPERVALAVSLEPWQQAMADFAEDLGARHEESIAAALADPKIARALEGSRRSGADATNVRLAQQLQQAREENARLQEDEVQFPGTSRPVGEASKDERILRQILMEMSDGPDEATG